jgi:small conductance mechanosensitive channel
MFLHKSNADSGIVSLLDSMIKLVLRILLGILILAALKINAGSVMAAIGASLITVGLVLKESLANLVSGILIVFNRPIHVGDYIEFGQSKGTVVRIDMLFTVLRGENEHTVIVPNSVLTSSVILRKSDWDACRFDFKYLLKNVKKFKDLERALELYIVTPENKILSNPPFEFKFTTDENGDSKMNFSVWVYKSNSSETKDNLKNFIQTQLKKNNAEVIKEEISQPYCNVN